MKILRMLVGLSIFAFALSLTLAQSAQTPQEICDATEPGELTEMQFDAAEQVLGDRFGFYRPPGGFFLWLNVGNGEEAARALWQNAGVRVLPGAHTAREDETGNNPGAPFIRVALVNEAATIHEACQRLVKVL